MKKKWKIISITWVGLYVLFILFCDNFYGAFTTETIEKLQKLPDISKEFQYFEIGDDHNDPKFSQYDTVHTGVYMGPYKYKKQDYYRYQFSQLFKKKDRNTEILVPANYRNPLIVREIKDIEVGQSGFLISTHLCDATLYKLKHKNKTIYTSSSAGNETFAYFYISSKNNILEPHYLDVKYNVDWIERSKSAYAAKLFWLPIAIMIDVILLPLQPIAYGLHGL